MWSDLLYNLFEILLISIAVEAVTEILTGAAIFEPLRNFLKKHSTFFYDLISCPYCCSVWVSAVFAWMTPLILVTQFHPILNLTCNLGITLFFLHRLANVVHELFSRWFARAPLTIYFNKIKKVS